MIDLLAPINCSSISISGIIFSVDEQGVVEIPLKLLEEALSHGFKRIQSGENRIQDVAEKDENIISMSVKKRGRPRHIA